MLQLIRLIGRTQSGPIFVGNCRAGLEQSTVSEDLTALIALKVASGASAQRIVDVGAAIQSITLTSRLSRRTCECARRPAGFPVRRSPSPLLVVEHRIEPAVEEELERFRRLGSAG